MTFLRFYVFLVMFASVSKQSNSTPARESSNSGCGLSRTRCATDVCSWKALKDYSQSEHVSRLALPTWCSSTSACHYCNKSVLNQRLFIAKDTENIGDTSANDNFCPNTNNCDVLGDIYNLKNSCPCKGIPMSGALSPLYLQEEIILVNLTSFKSCNELEVDIYVHFNLSLEESSCGSVTIPMRELCGPVIVHDFAHGWDFFWQISSTSYDSVWTWDSRSVHFIMSTYCCSSSSSNPKSNTNMTVFVNVSFEGETKPIVTAENIDLLQKCNSASVLKLNINYPLQYAQSLSYIDPNTSVFSCLPKNGYGAGNALKVPYGSSVTCTVRLKCLQTSSRVSSKCGDKRLEENVLIRALSSNCKNKLSLSSWSSLSRGVRMTYVQTNEFVWNGSVPKDLKHCLVTLQAVLNYTKRQDLNVPVNQTINTTFSVAYNCLKQKCYKPGSLGCDEDSTLQCKCESACTGLTSYGGDNCGELPWCAKTSNLVGIGLGCFVAVTVSTIFFICKICQKRKNSRPYRRLDQQPNQSNNGE